MKIYNATQELISILKQNLFNESCSLINFELKEGKIEVKESFCAFINDENSAISLFKELDCKLVVFASNPEIVIKLVNAGFKKYDILLVGIQDWSERDYSFLRCNNIKFYPIKEISIDGKDEVCDAVMSVCKDSERLHLHIDESILNNTGLTARELLYFIQRIRLLKAVKSITSNKNSNLSLKLMCELF